RYRSIARSSSLPRFLPSELARAGRRCSSRLPGPKRGLMYTLVLRRAAGMATGAILLWLVAAVPAAAQYGRPTMSDPAPGEKYHLEVSYGFLHPDLEATISSEQLGIIGTEIDVKSDLGYTNEAIRQFRLVLRPGRKHKVRNGDVPVKFEGDTILERSIIFNGIEFDAGLPVQSQFEWDTW